MIGISYFKKHERTAKEVLQSLEGDVELINLRDYKGVTVDELISVGGDGTFLKSISLNNFDKILGVKPINSVGAHCYCSISEWSGLVNKFLNKDYEVSERNKLRVSLNKEFIDYAGNEALISALRWGRAFKYELRINEEESILTSGSALFIYTKKGYSGFLEKLLNPYGCKVINAGFNGDGIASIASNNGFNEYKELPINYEVIVTIKNKRGAYLSVDGYKTEKELKIDDKVKVTPDKYKTIIF